MANFLSAQNFILNKEGGYANLLNDKGGETYRGISRNYNPDWTGWGIVDFYKQSYPNGVPNNTIFKDDALDKSVNDYYYSNYWKPIGADAIKSDSVALILYDAAVNSGLGTTQKIVSNVLGIKAKIPFTDTVNNINNYPDQEKLFELIKSEREKYYKTIGGGFLQGWLNRLNSISFKDIKNNLPVILVVVLMIIGASYILITNIQS